MRVFLTCPSLAPHGGIRVILEWANRLALRGHEVSLRTDDRGPLDWFALDPLVRLEHDDRSLAASDCLIVASPHAVDYLSRPDAPARRFAFMQMLEHLFRPHDREWQAQCQRFYLAPVPMILISRWNEEYVRRAGRTCATHYIGNGVNLEHFPLSTKPKDGRTVLVEGWWPGNPTKDSDRVAARVATRLRGEGYRTLAYGQHRPPRDAFRWVPHEYVVRPSLKQLNDLYERATILLKATRCDARSCSPMEAMTKGTVTARAIERGDDDLVHGENCLRCGYDADELYQAAKTLLSDQTLRERLAANCRAYVQEFTWDYWMDRVEEILWRS